jgi:hypothetical protein
VIGIDITRQTGKSKPRFSAEGVGEVTGTGCHAKLEPEATGNVSVSPSGTTYTVDGDGDVASEQ